MDRERLYEKLDIEDASDFRFYENFEALVEEEEHIEEELIKEIVSAAEPDMLMDHIESFFDAFAANIPDEETEMSILIDTFKNNMSSAFSGSMTSDDIQNISSEIYNFRNWYVIEHNAVDENTGDDISIRDARYELAASKLLGEDASMDFSKAVISGPSSYTVKLRDIIE